MLSIVVPAYNEEKRIEPMLESYGSFFLEKEKSEGLKTEIFVVINNTTDNTVKIVQKFAKKYSNIKYMDIKPGGKGFATTIGFKDALHKGSELIGFVDADMATKPESYYDLYKNMGNYHGVIASRWMKGSIVNARTSGKYIRSRSFNYLVRGLFLFPYKDTQCGAKLFRKEVIEKVVNHIEIPEWAFDVNILYLCKVNNFRIKEIPTVWDDKEGSTIDAIQVPLRMGGGVIRLRLLNSWFGFIIEAYDKLLAKRLKMHNLI